MKLVVLPRGRLPKVITPTSVSISAYKWLTLIGFVDQDSEFLTTDEH